MKRKEKKGKDKASSKALEQIYVHVAQIQNPVGNSKSFILLL